MVPTVSWKIPILFGYTPNLKTPNYFSSCKQDDWSKKNLPESAGCLCRAWPIRLEAESSADGAGAGGAASRPDDAASGARCSAGGGPGVAGYCAAAGGAAGAASSSRPASARCPLPSSRSYKKNIVL